MCTCTCIFPGREGPGPGDYDPTEPKVHTLYIHVLPFVYTCTYMYMYYTFIMIFSQFFRNVHVHVHKQKVRRISRVASICTWFAYIHVCTRYKLKVYSYRSCNGTAFTHSPCHHILLILLFLLWEGREPPKYKPRCSVSYVYVTVVVELSPLNEAKKRNGKGRSVSVLFKGRNF